MRRKIYPEGFMGDHLTGDELRDFLRGSDALREDAKINGLSEEENLERLVAISGRANRTWTRS